MVASGVSFGVVSRWLGSRAQNLEFEVLAVERGTVEETVSESGTVELGRQQVLKAPNESTVIAAVLVKAGDKVAPGQELIVLRSPEQQTRLAQHEIKLDQQQIAVNKSRFQVEKKRQDSDRSLREKLVALEKNQLQLATRQQQVAQATAKLADDRDRLKNSEALLARGFISGDELRDQQLSVRNSEVSLQEAQANLRSLTLDIQSGQQDLQQTQQTLQGDLRTAEAELADAQLALENLEIERQKIEAELQQNIVTAPAAGLVLDVSVKPGDVVELAKPLLVMGNPTQEFVQLKLPILTASKVATGQEARISPIGPESKTFTGRVTEVARLATTSSDDGRGDNSPIVAATVKLESPSRTLVPGSIVNVEIILEQSQDVITLPTEAVVRQGKAPFVWLLDDRRILQKQPVSLGLEGLTTVEIKTGLKAGDQVVVPLGETQFEPGLALPASSSQPDKPDSKDRPRK